MAHNTPRARRWPWLIAAAMFLMMMSLAVLSPSTGVAEDPPIGADEDEAESPEAMRRKIVERVRVIRAWKLTEHVHADEKTTIELLKILDDYDARFFEARSSQRKAERALRKAMRRPETSDAELTRLRKVVIARHKDIDALRYERLDRACAALPARPCVELMVFLPRFEREVRRMIKQQRRGDRRERGPRKRMRP